MGRWQIEKLLFGKFIDFCKISSLTRAGFCCQFLLLWGLIDYKTVIYLLSFTLTIDDWYWWRVPVEFPLRDSFTPEPTSKHAHLLVLLRIIYRHVKGNKRRVRGNLAIVSTDVIR